MHITLIVVGKLKERYWRDACAEYIKRLSAVAKITLLELLILIAHVWAVLDVQFKRSVIIS